MGHCWWLQEMVEIRGVCWQRWCRDKRGVLAEMVQCWWLQEMVEIRAVCWQKGCSAGGCRKWLRSDRCVGRDGTVLVAAGNG